MDTNKFKYNIDPPQLANPTPFQESTELNIYKEKRTDIQASTYIFSTCKILTFK